MQLVGNIEDLGLGEILQIVSFSRKSGILKLTSRKRDGSIVFKDGAVIRASSSVVKESVCDLLIKNGSITQEQLNNAKNIQQTGDFAESLGTILIKHLAFPLSQIDDQTSRHIETIIYSLFLWVDGSFVFELQEFSETPQFLRNDKLHFTLANGINPQFIAIEGSRLLDEYNREGKGRADEKEDEKNRIEQSSQDEAVSSPIVPSTEVLEQHSILIVDDDPLTRGVIRNSLTKMGFNATAFSDASGLEARVEELLKKDNIPVVVADLYMPTSDGNGMLGGLELLTRIRTEYPSVPVIVMSEYEHQETEREVRDGGAREFLIKPKKLQFRDDEITADVSDFIGRLAAALAATLSHETERPSQPQYLLQEYLIEMEDGEHFLEPGYVEPRVEESKGLRLMKEMLGELSKPLSISEIVLLILRFSSEIMNRAVVFAVKRDEIVGLGQYGIELKGESADRKVRKMRIPLHQPSILEEAVRTKSSILKKLDPSPCNDYIVKELGGFIPAASFSIPIMVQGRVMMALYGDNAPSNEPISDTSSLEIFLAQASIALERIVLEKRLSGR